MNRSLINDSYVSLDNECIACIYVYDYIIVYVYSIYMYMCDSIICVPYIPRILFVYIILYVRIYAIYSPPCIIDGVVYVYYMCIHVYNIICVYYILKKQSPYMTNYGRI